jgi:hypothetical protein
MLKLIKQYPMKMYKGMVVKIHVFLTLALASSVGRFNPEERATGTHWIGAVYRSGLRGEEKIRDRDSNSCSSNVQPVASRYTALSY